jgi:hypothetical protein
MTQQGWLVDLHGLKAHKGWESEVAEAYLSVGSPSHSS